MRGPEAQRESASLRSVRAAAKALGSEIRAHECLNHRPNNNPGPLPAYTSTRTDVSGSTSSQPSGTYPSAWYKSGPQVAGIGRAAALIARRARQGQVRVIVLAAERERLQMVALVARCLQGDAAVPAAATLEPPQHLLDVGAHLAPQRALALPAQPRVRLDALGVLGAPRSLPGALALARVDANFFPG